MLTIARVGWRPSNRLVVLIPNLLVLNKFLILIPAVTLANLGCNRRRRLMMVRLNLIVNVLVRRLLGVRRRVWRVRRPMCIRNSKIVSGPFGRLRWSL